MSTKWISTILLACAAQTLAGETMPWAKDYAAANATAAATGKLIMMDFTAPW